MAKVKIQGNASGTGVLTVTAPNTSTDRTIVLPDEDVTLGAATPSIDDNGNATAITISSSENVGIGTSSPNNPLHINGGASDTAFQITNSASGSAATDGFSITVENPTAAVAIRNREATDMKFLTSNTERMRIDSTGAVTMPSQPIFWARRTSSGSSGIQTGFSASVNIGNHFNGQKFTAPVTGVYEFYWQSIGPTGTSVADIYVYKNGSSNSTILSARPDETGATHAALSSAIGIASLSANDYIEIYSTGAIYSDGNSWHKFGGRLIG